jgi:hypothetical protein
MILADTDHFWVHICTNFATIAIFILYIARANARRRLVETLRKRQAISVHAAVNLEPVGSFETSILKELLGLGVILAVADKQTYYLDEQKHAEMIKQQKMVTMITLGGLALLAIGFGLGIWIAK